MQAVSAHPRATRVLASCMRMLLRNLDYAGRAGQGGQVVLLQSILRCDGLPVPMLRTAQYRTTPTNRITRLAEHLR